MTNYVDRRNAQVPITERTWTEIDSNIAMGLDLDTCATTTITIFIIITKVYPSIDSIVFPLYIPIAFSIIITMKYTFSNPGRMFYNE